MAVVRVEKSKNYTSMSNYHLRDRNLSLKAKGLLSVVLSLPENWDYSIEGLVSILKEEKTSIKSALNELKENHYLIVFKLKPLENVRSHFEYEYVFYEHKYSKEDVKKTVESLGIETLGIETLGIENLHLESLAIENDTQINKDYYHHHHNNKELIINLLEDNGILLTPLQLDTINSWLDYDLDLIKYVVKKALNNGSPKIGYIDKILYNYQQKGIRTIQQAIQDDDDFKKQQEQRKMRYRKGDSYEESKELLENWVKKKEAEKKE